MNSNGYGQQIFAFHSMKEDINSRTVWFGTFSFVFVELNRREVRLEGRKDDSQRSAVSWVRGRPARPGCGSVSQHHQMGAEASQSGTARAGTTPPLPAILSVGFVWWKFAVTGSIKCACVLGKSEVGNTRE